MLKHSCKSKFLGKKQVVDFDRKSTTCFGGEQGIRTLDTGFGPYTRLAGERLRPTRPTLQKNDGGGGGIRTHGTCTLNGFQDRLLKPLGHPSPVARGTLFNITQVAPLVNDPFRSFSEISLILPVSSLS